MEKDGPNAFEAVGASDAAHLRSVGRPVGFAPEYLTGRASDLSLALKPLHAIKPVLSNRYLVKGWLDRGAASVVYGESNVGKTFFALDLALHVAAAMDWHGCKISPNQSRVGDVVYVAGHAVRPGLCVLAT